MADTLRHAERNPERRRQYVAGQMIVFVRTYQFGRFAMAALPSRGDAVDLDGVSGSAVMQPRVLRVLSSHRDKTGQQQVTIAFYQIRPYSGTPTEEGTELRGSRNPDEDGYYRYVRRYFASTDGSTGLPSEGDLYPGDSGVLGRRCVNVSTLYDVQMPGLYYTTATYKSFKSY